MDIAPSLKPFNPNAKKWPFFLEARLFFGLLIRFNKMESLINNDLKNPKTEL